MATVDAATVEKTNQMWWDKHSPDYPHHCTTPLDVTGKDFPMGPAHHNYGRFIYCPMPQSDHTRWGFEEKAALDRFLADVAAGTLPVASAVGYVAGAYKAPPRPTQPAPDPFDLIGDDTPAAAAVEPAPAPVAAKVEPTPAPEPDDGEEETDEWGTVIKKAALAPAAEDPFADLL